jgi:V-type H+-transporting ATPase subunit D
VSNKKQRDTAAADAEIQAAREKEAQKQKTALEPEKEESDAPDVFGEQEDADVIF